MVALAVGIVAQVWNTAIRRSTTASSRISNYPPVLVLAVEDFFPTCVRHVLGGNQLHGVLLGIGVLPELDYALTSGPPGSQVRGAIFQSKVSDTK